MKGLKVKYDLTYRGKRTSVKIDAFLDVMLTDIFIANPNLELHKKKSIRQNIQDCIEAQLVESDVPLSYQVREIIIRIIIRFGSCVQ